MKMSFRWYGKKDPVTLEEIKVIPGMQGIVTAVYDVPVGQAWPLENILELKKMVEEAGLEITVIESIPVHEDIKQGKPNRDALIENYKTSIRMLGLQVFQLYATISCLCLTGHVQTCTTHFQMVQPL